MNPPGEVAVRFDHVWKSIGPTPVLKDVSFEVPYGTAFSILGRRGAGKTVTLKLGIGLLKPDRGRIFLNGQEITALNHADLLRVRKSTAFVFQSAAVFDSISVAENIAFPLRHNCGGTREELHDKVYRHLGQVGLRPYIDKMPHELSAGMRKLLGFARALSCDPAILFLDDPWSGLDSVTVASLCDLLASLKRRYDTALVIAANRMSQVRSISEQFAVLDGGNLIACGSPDDMAQCDDPAVKQFVSEQDF